MLSGKAIFVVLVLVVAGAGAGAYFVLSDKEKDEEKNQYILSFDTNGGTGTFEDMAFSDSSETDTIPNTEPVRENTEFKEWNTKADGTGKTYKPGDTISLSQNMILYAVYTVTLSFELDEGAWTGSAVTGIIGTISIPNVVPTKNKTSFKEWNTKADGTGNTYSPGATITISENTTLFAVYAIVLSFESNGGGVFESIDFEYDETKTIHAYAPVRTDADFKEWNTKKDGTGSAYAPGSQITLTMRTTLYAVYECILKFENTYGTGFSEKAVLGSTYSFKAAEAIEGASFERWVGFYEGNSLSCPGESEWVVGGHITFTAFYKSTIVYHDLGSTSPFYEFTANYGTEVSLGDLGDRSPEAWKVYKWNTAKDGSGTEYDFGASFQMKDIDLYAVNRDWTTSDAEVGTFFVYDVTGVVLNPDKYPFIKNVLDLINSKMEENGELANLRITLGIIGVSGEYTQTITGIDADTGDITYTREGLVDVSIPFMIENADGSKITNKIILGILRTVLLKIPGIEAGNLLYEFMYPIEDVSLTSTDGFNMPGEVITKVSEIDAIVSVDAPYPHPVFGREVIPVKVMKDLEIFVIDKPSKVLLSTDFKIPTQVEISAELSGAGGLPWMGAVE